MLLHWVLGFSISDDHGYLWKSFPGSSRLRKDVLKEVLYGITLRQKCIHILFKIIFYIIVFIFLYIPLKNCKVILRFSVLFTF